MAAAGERIQVPAHWATEVLNGVTRAARRGRLDDRAVSLFLDLLPVFNLVVDQRSLPEQWRDARPLVMRYRLSAYDAAYRARAKLEGASLATLEAQLRRAAVAEGVLLEV